MILLGDVHGKFNSPKFKSILEKFPNETIIQLGDLGVGFPNHPYPQFPDNFKFISGNHDNPNVLPKIPNWLGKYGYIEKLELFYFSGAWSIDFQNRTEGIDWWRDEELSYKECLDAIELYSEKKPKMVISHDCPDDVGQYLYGKNKIRTGTSDALQCMLDLHSPSTFYFGHHHLSFNTKIKNCYFQCLSELEIKEIPNLNF